MTEFELIKHYFAQQSLHRPDVMLGIGDDAAILSIPAGMELAVTTDTLALDVHFPASASPYDIGYKSLAVNLSDLAAMGATPAWVTLAITLPQADESWIHSFCDGFFTLANRYQVQLIGGDLTHGPLAITVQAIGFIPTRKAILRSGAKAGDLIYVTGTLGEAGLALLSLQGKASPVPEDILTRLHRPEPRVTVGEAIRDIAHAAIDISDGLTADLGHILEQSHVGAIIYVDQLPLSHLPHEGGIHLALTAGDDYELCFTIPTDKRAELEAKLTALSCRYTCIGTITEQTGLDLRYQNGKKYHGQIGGYQHF
ncbi:MAG: thiamine-phosphate kinase [Gammaproteobacteria bacterium]|nr:MAG: thiamine-phosphate kinase [Gammaproteobacteria bacterium]